MSKLLDETKNIAKKFNSNGAIIILQKANDEGQKIAQFNLNHSQIRECLSIATYYNEKIELEKQ